MANVGRPHRAVGVLSGAIVLLIVALLAGGGGSDRADAATETCVKHARRVVIHAKRHGKRTRVVRTKHYWTCEEVPTPATAAPGPPAAPASDAQISAPAAQAPSTPPALPAPAIEAPKFEPPLAPESGPQPEPNALGVAAEDKEGFRYSLTRQTVKAGSLVVQLTNKGEDPHTMDLQRVGPNGELEGPILAELAAEPNSEPGRPQPTATIEVQPGTYRMWCTIGHHAEHGMKAEFTVE